MQQTHIYAHTNETGIQRVSHSKQCVRCCVFMQFVTIFSVSISNHLPVSAHKINNSVVFTVQVEYKNSNSNILLHDSITKNKYIQSLVTLQYHKLMLCYRYFVVVTLVPIVLASNN